MFQAHEGSLLQAPEVAVSAGSRSLMRIRPRRQWLRLRRVGSSGRITIDAGSGCGRILTALLQATAHDGRRELRAARAFEDVLRQLAELLQR